MLRKYILIVNFLYHLLGFYAVPGTNTIMSMMCDPVRVLVR
jgi:hypothetical protein